ncbi:PREDICTED: 60S ribosomal protein L18a-like protein [Camelina sativa]|uniref:60S ribosomal protein L18a-like protein n=1 Tax=Camelina sativa TaxID=90675 RepID=A0ABM0TZ91_CAMSA|nr:PREDICTED: 60S ribosomal protein L18a-like protein [Camelina sativa]XP_010433560.1 PREDICTED: 60S ribosomal protein L18a-like protein [Camelina sativa]XP_010438806.1 PREDICTED: 60S ribosomal protein L18a-like protein [Camelina sativa]
MGETVKESGDASSELVKSIGDKHASLVRPAAKYYSALKDAMVCGKGRYTLVKDVDEVESGAYYDKPLPCFGCGIGWFSFLLGFLFPFLWYYATFLYFGNYYRKDPRERAGLAASAITAMGFSLLLLVILVFRWF